MGKSSTVVNEPWRTKKRKKWPFVLLGIILILVFAIMLVVNSEAYHMASDYLAKNEALHQMYGDSYSWTLLSGSVKENIYNGQSSGDATFTVKIDKETYTIVLHQSPEGVWNICSDCSTI